MRSSAHTADTNRNRHGARTSTAAMSTFTYKRSYIQALQEVQPQARSRSEQTLDKVNQRSIVHRYNRNHSASSKLLSSLDPESDTSTCLPSTRRLKCSSSADVFDSRHLRRESDPDLRRTGSSAGALEAVLYGPVANKSCAKVNQRGCMVSEVKVKIRR